MSIIQEPIRTLQHNVSDVLVREYGLIVDKDVMTVATTSGVRIYLGCDSHRCRDLISPNIFAHSIECMMKVLYPDCCVRYQDINPLSMQSMVNDAIGGAFDIVYPHAFSVFSFKTTELHGQLGCMYCGNIQQYTHQQHYIAEQYECLTYKYICPRCCSTMVRMVDIDKELHYVLELLWKKGLSTKFCCSGHGKNGNIIFTRDISEIFFPLVRKFPDTISIADKHKLRFTSTSLITDIENYVFSLDDLYLLSILTQEHEGV